MTNNELKVVNVRLVKDESLYSDREIHSKYDAIEIMGNELRKYDREVFCVLNLKSNGSVINMNVVSMGTLNSSLVSPREVFKSSILSNAAYMIAIHNHPSGTVKPSREDFETTKRLVDCGKILEIPMIDHLIVASRSNEIYSFAENGVLGKTMDELNQDFFGRSR